METETITRWGGEIPVYETPEKDDTALEDGVW